MRRPRWPRWPPGAGDVERGGAPARPAARPSRTAPRRRATTGCAAVGGRLVEVARCRMASQLPLKVTAPSTCWPSPTSRSDPITQAAVQHTSSSTPERRQQAAGAATPEVPQPDPPGGRVLGEQQAGDQEAADDEEDVDAEEPAGQHARSQVEQDHRQNGDRAQPVQPRVSRRARGRRAGRGDRDFCGRGSGGGHGVRLSIVPRSDLPGQTRRPLVRGHCGVRGSLSWRKRAANRLGACTTTRPPASAWTSPTTGPPSSAGRGSQGCAPCRGRSKRRWA